MLIFSSIWKSYYLAPIFFNGLNSTALSLILNNIRSPLLDAIATVTGSHGFQEIEVIDTPVLILSGTK